jgi:NAD(P)H-hydrate epimerase
MAHEPLPVLTNAQAKELERLMLQHYHIGWPQMLENAGRALAQLACDLLNGEVVDRPIVVLAGRGPNGGGGLAAARHLLNWGAWVQVVCAYPAGEYRGAPGEQLAALQAMGAPLAWAEDGWELPPCDLLIDAVIGHGLRGDPRGPARSLIALANSNAAPILSLDAPSGVDSEGGRLFAPHMQAAATLALALPKAGLRAPAAAAACGDLYLADIGAPAALYAQLGIASPPVFTCNPILPLHVEDQEIWVRE